jgi:tetratricopeptide (TPR) repeat protein
VLVAVVLVAAAPQAAAAQPPPPGGSITVSVPSGARPTPGTYRVTLDSAAGPVEIQIVVAPAAGSDAAATPSAPEQAPSADPASGGPGVGWLLLGAAILLLAAIGAAALYVRVWVPRRPLRRYQLVLAQLAAKRYDLARPGLTQLESTLPERVRSEARFFIAFAAYRLGDVPDAEQRLAALHGEDPAARDVAYLLAHLRSERQDHDGAEAVLTRLGAARLRADDELRRLYGSIQAHRAFAALRDGRTDAAAELFKQVEDLGDFAEIVPVDLRNRYVLVGTRALFDRDVPTAREQFTSLQRSLASGEAPDRAPLLAAALLGQGLADWIEERGTPSTQTEQLLVMALHQLNPDEELTAPWPDEAADVGLTDRVEQMITRADRPPEEINRERTRRDIHFLRGMAVLRKWRATGPPADGAEGPDFLAAALGCFGRARELDPEFSDVHVVVGLLRYYLADDGEGRRAGLAVLREANKLGTRDPEVLQILNHDERVQRADRDAAATFLQILDGYVADATVRQDVREALLARMAERGEVQDWDARHELVRARVVVPTVAEVQARSELLLARVADLLQEGPGSADLSDAHDLSARLQERSRAIAEQARAIEEQEAALLALLGERLLSGVE